MARTISSRYVAVTVTTPAGTAIAAPQTTAVNLGDVILLGVQLKIPPGHAGATGWKLTEAGNALVPWQDGGGWVIGDDDDLWFDVNSEVAGGLAIVTYNVGAYPHTHYAIAKVTDLAGSATSSAPAPTLTLVPNNALSSVQVAS